MISPLLWCAAAGWIGAIGGTETALASWRAASGFPLVLLALIAAALLLAVRLLKVSRTLGSVVTLGVLVMLLALARGAAIASVSARLENASPRAWTVTVVGDAQRGQFGTSVAVRLDEAPFLTAWMSVPEEQPIPLYGQRLTVWTRVRVALRGQVASDRAFRSGSLLRLKPWRIRSEGWAAAPLGAVAKWRNAGIARLGRIGTAGAEALASMLYGADPSGPGLQAQQDARTAGVAWAVAASGLHLAVLIVLADRAAALAGLSRKGRATAAVVVAAGMALACGLKLSLMRAALVAAAGVGARAMGRRRDPTAALGAVLIVLLLVDPGGAYDTGLLLGSLAVAGIALFGPMSREWMRPVVGGRLATLSGAAVAAQLVVGPLVAALFGGVSVLGPVALLGSAPFISLSVGIGIVAGLLGEALPAASTLLLRVAASAADVAARLWSLVASVPWNFIAVSSVPVWFAAAWMAAGAVLWLRWPSPRRAARVRAGAAGMGALLVAALLLRGAGVAGVVVLDVGQGDAVLIRDAGHSVLVDTGPDPLVLRRALARAGVTSLDGLVLTHTHADHTGGLDGLAGVARPAWIGVPDVVDSAVDELASSCAARAPSVLRLHRGMRFVVGRAQVEVIWPKGGERNLSANDTSVILLVRKGERTALLLGDAETDAQEGALPAWRARVDCLKVAHHGSPNGNVPDALAVWRPTVALISVGAGNRFGHPSQAALSALAGVGAVVLRTDRAGDLTWSLDTAATSARAAGSAALCDNRTVSIARLANAFGTRGSGEWLPPTYRISNRSISSTAPSSCCCSAPRSAFATVSRRSPTWISTWTRSTARPPPRTTSSMRRTPCRS